MDSIDQVCDDAEWWALHGDLGYDQADRWSWRDSGYRPHTEVDCSSFVISLLKKHGYPTGAASYTGDMAQELCRHGWRKVPNDGNPRRGDILLNYVHHTALYLGSGRLAQASRGESGHRVSGGAPGDQDGWETNVRGYYDYPWDCYLRYVGTGSTAPKGGIEEDGWWGGETTRALQRLLGVEVDGVISGQPEENRPLVQAASYGWEWVSGRADGSVTVARLQGVWGARVDGLLGPETIRCMQRYYGTTVDGVLSGPSLAVEAMQRAVNAGRP